MEDEQALADAIQAARNAGLPEESFAEAEQRLFEHRSAREAVEAAAEPELTEEAPLEDYIAATGAQWEATFGEANPAKRRKIETGEEFEAGEDDTSGVAQSMDEAAALASALDEAINAAAGAAATNEEASREWALCRLEVAILHCRKQRCVEDEDFDLALEVKLLEGSAAKRLEAAKQRYTDSHAGSGNSADGPDVATQLAELERQKQKAAADEDFELCAQLQAKKRDLEQRAAAPPDVRAELERVRAHKREAAAHEDFELASQLKLQEVELERRMVS